MARDCTQGGGRGGGGGGRGGSYGGGGGPRGPMKCYNCQGEGHMSRECTEPRKFPYFDLILLPLLFGC
jgi:cellular nucleic acid-binding protein